jgi:2-dehydro-3-deoxygluconokinase
MTSLTPIAPAVVGLGEVMLRLSPGTGRRIETADVLHMYAAGSEANVLAALARLGVPTAFVTALPESQLGRRVAAELAAAGVQLQHVDWIEDGRMGAFFVEQGVGARSTTVLYDRGGSTFARSASWPTGVLEGAETRFAMISGITPALSSAAAEAANAMVAEVKHCGVALCVDVNYRARLWSADEARTHLAPMLAQAEVVVCAARDAENVFGADPDNPAAFRARHAPRASVCVITAGEAGCRAVGDSDDLITVEAVPTQVVGRLGLGDAFVAGLLDGLLQHRTVEAALRAGAALAALKATTHGDLSLARRKDLEALLAESHPAPLFR